MLANLGNSAVATGLKNVHFYSNPRERQCQRMFKLPFSCIHFTCQQEYAQNPSSQASAHKPRISISPSWVQKRQTNQRLSCQHLLNHRKSKGIKKQKQKQTNKQKKTTSASLTTLKPFTVWSTRNCGKFLKRWEYQITLPAS